MAPKRRRTTRRRLSGAACAKLIRKVVDLEKAIHQRIGTPAKSPADARNFLRMVREYERDFRKYKAGGCMPKNRIVFS